MTTQQETVREYSESADWTRSKVSNGRNRIQKGCIVAIETPDGSGWEIYSVDADGLEMFDRYAHHREVRIFDEALNG